MHELLEAICQSLDSLSSFVESSYTDDRTLRESIGWNLPALTRHDLASLPALLASRIRDANAEELDDELSERLESVPQNLKLLHSETVPYMFTGNGGQAIPAFLATLEWLSATLEPVIGWQKIHDSKTMPAPLARRLRGIKAELETLVPEKEKLQDQIRTIQEATDAAESLPTDLQSLREARNVIQNLSSQSAEIKGQIDGFLRYARESATEIASNQQESKELIRQSHEAYRVTTTHGLAAAFDLRAKWLDRSMWIWVLLLLGALLIGTYLGKQRIELLTNAMAQSDPKWGFIWMQVVLSFVSVGAPIWFAWVSTKQIGQRFRLAEDYSFKASVAKAYEGYRREAARIDGRHDAEEFETRLFSSALDRLEEPPLRLVENIVHGSPWHEFLSSKIRVSQKQNAKAQEEIEEAEK